MNYGDPKLISGDNSFPLISYAVWYNSFCISQNAKAALFPFHYLIQISFSHLQIIQRSVIFIVATHSFE